MFGRAFLASARDLLANPSEANWRSAACARIEDRGSRIEGEAHGLLSILHPLSSILGPLAVAAIRASLPPP